MKMLANGLLGKAMLISACAMALLMNEGHAVGQCIEQKLLPSDGGEIDVFGQSVSISGDPGNEVAIVGAGGNRNNGFGTGSAYIYRKSPDTSDWVQEAKLHAPEVVVHDRIGRSFGQSVSISGPTGNEVVIIGDPRGLNNDVLSGTAYIFRFNPHTSEWVEEAKLFASDGAWLDNFGGSVSISGPPGNEVAIIGAYKDDDNGTDSGSVYIFRKSGENWIEEQKLLPSDGAAEDFFGLRVSINGVPDNEVAIVGAFRDDNNGADSGSAYIFRYDPGLSGWVQEAKLLSSDGAAGDLFGHSVSISGPPRNNVAIVGAYRHDDHGTDSGAAYIFRQRHRRWVQEAKLLASDGMEGDAFGASTSIRGAPGKMVAIIGAPWDDDNGTDSGSAYIYHKRGANWVQEQKLLASDGAADDWFGFPVSISGASGNEVAIVGAYRDDDNGQFSGSAYIIDVPCSSPTCPADTDTNGEVNVTDLLLLLGNWGPCPPPCPSNTNGDDAVNVTDLLALLAAWGPCP